MAQVSLERIDQTGLKVGTATTILLLAVAFLLNSWLVVLVVAVCQLASALGLSSAPYRLLYQHIVKPSGLLTPRIVRDNAEPHQFAMLLGAIFNGLGAVLIATAGEGIGIASWVLVGIVFLLANLQFWLNFCAGCWMYYQLNRLGVAGFRKPAPDKIKHDGGEV